MCHTMKLTDIQPHGAISSGTLLLLFSACLKQISSKITLVLLIFLSSFYRGIRSRLILAFVLDSRGYNLTDSTSAFRYCFANSACAFCNHLSNGPRRFSNQRFQSTIFHEGNGAHVISALKLKSTFGRQTIHTFVARRCVCPVMNKRSFSDRSSAES